MSEKLIPQSPTKIDCSVCLNEIPPSVENSLEGPDYVYFYFGAQCYSQWKNDSDTKDGTRD